jgi:hypothetical protein
LNITICSKETLNALVRILSGESFENPEGELTVEERITNCFLYTFDLLEVLEERPMKAVYFKQDDSSSGLTFIDISSQSKVVLYTYHYESGKLIDYSKDEEDDNIDTEDETVYELSNYQFGKPVINLGLSEMALRILTKGLLSEEERMSSDIQSIIDKKFPDLTLLILNNHDYKDIFYF